MKIYINILFFIVFGTSLQAQQSTDLYKDYSARVPGFTWNETEIHKKDEGLGEIEAQNKNGDIVRFKVDKNDRLSAYHCLISYIVYAFKDSFITTITTYDRDGKIKGDAEFKDVAVIRFEVLQPEALKKKFITIDEADGNISLRDEADKLVLKRVYSSNMELLAEKYISSDEYWRMQHLLYRP